MPFSLFRFVAILCCLALAGPRVQSQTLHLLTCIDNINEDIRSGCMKDKQKAITLFGAIAQDAGMQFQQHSLDFDTHSMLTGLENLHCGPEDAVVFLFSGHGFKFEIDDEEWRWPILFFCDKSAYKSPGSENCEFDLDLVQMYLQNCGARMTITLGDCCNNAPDSQASQAKRDTRPYPQFEINQEYDRLELFTRFHGHIIASASSPGETGITTDEDGSNFSNTFFNTLFDALKPDAAAVTWQQILDRTRAGVMDASPGQTPQYWIEK